MLRKTSLSILSLIGFILACQFVEGKFFATPTPNPGPQQTIQAMLQSTQNAQHTVIFGTRYAQATINAQGTQDALATSAQLTQIILDRIATSTQAKADQLTSTAEVVLRQTEQARPMIAKVEELFNAGILPSTEGVFHPIEDFDESFAKENYLRWWRTEYSPENFLIMAHTKWSSATSYADWESSGCGFTFGMKDNANYHVVALNLDGRVRLKGQRNDKWFTLASVKYGDVNKSEGEVDVLLVVVKNKIYYYINDQLIIDEIEYRIIPGDLSFVIFSGTSKDYGTRCEFTNIGLWIIK